MAQNLSGNRMVSGAELYGSHYIYFRGHKCLEQGKSVRIVQIKVAFHQTVGRWPMVGNAEDGNNTIRFRYSALK